VKLKHPCLPDPGIQAGMTAYVNYATTQRPHFTIKNYFC
jgi:hypothetical protein